MAPSERVPLRQQSVDAVAQFVASVGCVNFLTIACKVNGTKSIG
jgi:hypothetical protein